MTPETATAEEKKMGNELDFKPIPSEEVGGHYEGGRYITPEPESQTQETQEAQVGGIYEGKTQPQPTLVQEPIQGQQEPRGSEDIYLRHTRLKNSIVFLLEQSGIYKIRDLINMTPTDIRKVRGIGANKVRQIGYVLDDYGLGFKEETEPTEPREETSVPTVQTKEPLPDSIEHLSGKISIPAMEGLRKSGIKTLTELRQTNRKELIQGFRMTPWWATQISMAMGKLGIPLKQGGWKTDQEEQRSKELYQERKRHGLKEPSHNIHRPGHVGTGNIPKSILNRSLRGLEFTPLLKERLDRLHITTVGELGGYTSSEMIEKGISSTQNKQIVEALTGLGIQRSWVNKYGRRHPMSMIPETVRETVRKTVSKVKVTKPKPPVSVKHSGDVLRIPLSELEPYRNFTFKTLDKLNDLGIKTIGDFANAKTKDLKNLSSTASEALRGELKRLGIKRGLWSRSGRQVTTASVNGSAKSGHSTSTSDSEHWTQKPENQSRVQKQIREMNERKQQLANMGHDLDTDFEDDLTVTIPTGEEQENVNKSAEHIGFIIGYALHSVEAWINKFAESTGGKISSAELTQRLGQLLSSPESGEVLGIKD